MTPLQPLTGLIILFILIFTGLPHPVSARPSIEKKDYSASWHQYRESSAMTTPARDYPYGECFAKAAKTHDLPLTLLLAVARAESDFNPNAKSSKSCYGIMQIQWPGTARDLGLNNLEDLYDPCKNIRAGAAYLKQLIHRYKGDYHLAIAAYNYGPGRIRSGSTPPRGAQWYSGYVYHHLETILGDTPGKIPAHGKRKTYVPGIKIPVILFHDPFRARRFLDYYSTKAKEIRLDWFMTSLGETHIVLLHNSEAEMRKGIEQLGKMGFVIDPEK